MKISQEQKYQSITLVLETKEEAEAVWVIALRLADWFTHVAKL